MGLLKTVFDMKTVKYRSGLQKRINDELLFEMPVIGAEPAVILGATRATALMVEAAVEAGHERFVIAGGKKVGDEDPRFTALLVPGLESKGLPLPASGNTREYEYAREILHKHYGVPDQNIITLGHDRSSNMQENFELLSLAGFSRMRAVDLYTMAGTARRAIATARKVWNDNFTPIAAHNVYPAGIDRKNWMEHAASRFYALSEADKILAAPDKASRYEAMGFCRRIDMTVERALVEDCIRRKCGKTGPAPLQP